MRSPRLRLPGGRRGYGTGSHVLHRDLRKRLPVAVRGEGPYIFDSDGRRYLDASGGPGVSCVGHSHPRVLAALKAQADAIPYAYSLFFTSPAMEQLADLLVRHAPPGLERAFFCSGGAEAVEGAVKLARQYFLEVGQPQRRHVLARRQSYHGNTVGALALGGDLARRAAYAPFLLPFEQIAPCYAYRLRRPDETLEEYALRAADELEAAIQRLGPETVAAFVCEPVIGSTIGCVPPAPGYLQRIRDICDSHGVVLIFDEVMCGMGRTGHLYACSEDEVSPDIVAIAKGLGGGYAPIGGFLASAAICAALERGSGYLQHGHTYAGHTLACAAALAVQTVIQEEGLLDNCRRMGTLLADRLREEFGGHPHVGDIRGRGLFLSLELVQDRATKACFPVEDAVWLRVRNAGLEEGLITYPTGGCANGAQGDQVLLAPPLNYTAGHVDKTVTRLARALARALPS